MHKLIVFSLALLYFNVAIAADVYSEDKTAFIINANQPEFSIKLKSNPTTGYSWFLRSYDGNLVKPVKHAFIPPTDTKLVGAPGYEVWTFKMKPEAFEVPLQTVMRFVYARPWEMVGKDSTVLDFQIVT